MADGTKTLTVEFSATDKISSVVGNINKNLQTMTSHMGVLQESFVAFGALEGLTKTFEGFVGQAAKAESSLNRVKTAIQITGAGWEENSEKVKELINHLSEITTLSRGDLRSGFENLTLLTGQVSLAYENLGIAADISKQRNIDMATAARYVELALQGETGRLGMLIPELKHLSDAVGDNSTQMQRADYIMGVLRRTFGGFAQSEAKTSQGAFDQMEKSIHHLETTIGKVFIPVSVAFSNKLRELSEETTAFIQRNEALTKTFGVLFTVIGGGLFVITALGLALKALSISITTLTAVNPILLSIMAVIVPLTYGIGSFISKLNEGAEYGGRLATMVDTGLNPAIKGAIGTFNFMSGALHNFRDDMYGAGVSAMNFSGNAVDAFLRIDKGVPTTQKLNEEIERLKLYAESADSVTRKWANEGLKSLYESLDTTKERVKKLRDEFHSLIEEMSRERTIRSEEGLTGREKPFRTLPSQDTFAHFDFTTLVPKENAFEKVKEQITTLQSLGISFANNFASGLSRVFGQIRSLADLSALKIKDVFQALGDTILDMLAQIAARMAVFGLLSLIPGGGALLGGLGSFVFGTARGNSVGGGNTIPAIVPQNSFNQGGNRAGNTYNIQIGRFIGTQENARELGQEIERMKRYGQL